MIKYTLTCTKGHAFESWFRDSLGYDDLAESGQLTCPVCGSAEVRKAVMAPSVVRGRRAGSEQRAQAGAAEPQGVVQHPIALLDERERKVREMMRDLHRKITENADDVGRNFATEARRMHEGETPVRSIYGEATGEEVRSLLDDGVPLLPMPVLPDDHH
ncbi:DUF1178 family protein [Lichenihabitans psoromatis]|uniref:DUF1178 family protein n=1 Tax=Lichenihabitans psoromatis TaxID=2528642 RepID=UPI0010383947|nr:DUF1178 family protein [Lichenihabitans psoromatis]